MKYDQAMDYMGQVSKYGSVLGLESIRELLNRLDNPEDKLAFVHIAGTNGKGSTAAYIANILAEDGYKVGRYISPVIMEYCEKIEVTCQDENGDVNTLYIKEDDVAKHLSVIKGVCDQMVEEGLAHPTPFEIETAMAFLEFIEQECDLVIMEVGMGGRLDATNVIRNTKVAVLTSISMDHMAFLGDSLEKIAREKAGIIKPFSRVVCYEQTDKVTQIIKEQCSRCSVPLTSCDFSQIKNVRYEEDRTTFDYMKFTRLKIRLLGKIQVKNAVLAIEAIRQLRECGYNISGEGIRKGLARTKWKGRFEKVCANPPVYLDGAHNEGAAQALEETIKIYFDKKKFVFVVGMFADKEYEKVLKITSPYASRIYTVTPDNSRALPSEKLAKSARNYCKEVYDAGAVNVGLEQAVEYSNMHGKLPILVFGSLSFHSSVYRFFQGVLAIE